MKKYNIPVFSIPICCGTLGEKNRTLNKELITDLYNYANEKELVKRSGINIKQTKPVLEDLYDSFKKLQTILNVFIKDYIYWSGVKNNTFNCKNFWGNINTDPVAFHMPHSHSFNNNIFSGVYYPTSGFFNNEEISVNQNLDEIVEITSKTQPNPGSLVLLDPLEYVKTGIASNNTERYPFFGNPICIEPKESTVVLFPSYLSHLVTPTKKENFIRISIAFGIEIN